MLLGLSNDKSDILYRLPFEDLFSDFIEKTLFTGTCAIWRGTICIGTNMHASSTRAYNTIMMPTISGVKKVRSGDL
jgi:hypothetical protein